VVAVLLVVANVVTVIAAVAAGIVVAAAAAAAATAGGVADALYHSTVARSSHMGTLSLTYLLGPTDDHR